MAFKNLFMALANVAQLVGASSCKPKGCGDADVGQQDPVLWLQ